MYTLHLSLSLASASSQVYPVKIQFPNVIESIIILITQSVGSHIAVATRAILKNERKHTRRTESCERGKTGFKQTAKDGKDETLHTKQQGCELGNTL